MKGPHQLLLGLLVALFFEATTAGFSLGVRDSIMIAHSFKGERFGPAQKLHGATYTVDVEFSSPGLEPEVNWVVDIGAAGDALSKVLSAYNFENLDELFPGENTTTEFMCRKIHEGIARECRNGESMEGFNGEVCVKLWESHKAWACYKATV
ncbi:unnamed protein product [Chrysoparadoxa australica]